MSEKKRVAICRKCGEPMVFSFCLPYCEWVCVPCGIGVGMIDNDVYKEISLQQYEKLRKKYKQDIDKKSLETAKNGGGECKICGKKFNCENCKKIEKSDYKFWGINQ